MCVANFYLDVRIVYLNFLLFLEKPMSKKLSYSISALALALACLAAPSTASAASINMLQTLMPAPGEANPFGGNIVATITVPVVSSTYSGILTSTVYANDASSPYSGLTFTYLLSNDASSAQPIGRLTVNGYAGYLTDASYESPAIGLPPTLINRSVSDVVGFSFFAGVGPGVLSPGMTSSVMVIQTDAPSWQPNFGSVINGHVSSVPILSPVPEPGTLALLGLGALLMVRRRFAH